jgi:hypothetical protein
MAKRDGLISIPRKVLGASLNLIGATPRFLNPRIMGIYIGKAGQVLGSYYPD